MKKLIVIAIALISVISCASYKSIPEDIDSFVDKAEIKAPGYNMSDWETSKAEYEALVDQFTDNFSKFTDDQKALATNAMGRYHALLVKNGLAESVGVLNMIKNLIPSYIDGITGVLKENEQEIVNTLSGILDLNSIGSSLNDLGTEIGGLLENIFNAVEKNNQKSE